MESIRSAPAVVGVQDAVQEEFNRGFDAMVDTWVAVHGDYDETRDCLDALVETRAVMASMHAREQRLLARLETIAQSSR